MKNKIKKHGSLRNYFLNLALLGVSGALLIRLLALLIYAVLPNYYFLEIEEVHINDTMWCGSADIQVLEGYTVRNVYQYLPDSLIKIRSLQTETIIELFRYPNDAKVDDIHRTPVVEWREGGYNPIEFNFDTILLPGQYYIEISSYIVLPMLGKRDDEPVRKESNIFTIRECN